MKRTTHSDLSDAIREGVTELLSEIGERFGCELPEALCLAAEIVAQERDARSYAKVVRTSPRNVSVRLQGLSGIEQFDVYDDGKRVRVTQKVRGRARTVTPDSADWRKVMNAYRAASIA